MTWKPLRAVEMDVLATRLDERGSSEENHSICARVTEIAMSTINTDVLVVGAGPAGLTASALLAKLKVPSITVTKNDGTPNSPRAHIPNKQPVQPLQHPASHN